MIPHHGHTGATGGEPAGCTGSTGGAGAPHDPNGPCDPHDPCWSGHGCDLNHDLLLGSWDRWFLHGSDGPTTGHGCGIDHWGGQFSLPEMIRCLVSDLCHVSGSCGEHWTPDSDRGHGMGSTTDGRGHGSVGCLEDDYRSQHHCPIATHHC